MPVNSTHKDYDSHIKQWSRCRDCVGGTDAVKNRGTEYLPKLSKQDSDEYNAYKMRASFFGATGRTIQGLMGAVFRIDPTPEYPTNMENHTKTFTVHGLSLLEYGRQVFKEVLGVGRIGLLVDMDSTGADRAYASVYLTESIINWRTKMVDGKQKLVLVILKEKYDELESDGFEAQEKTQFRVLHIVDNRYQVEIYREGTGEGAGVWTSDLDLFEEPLRVGKRLDFIPFQFVNAYNLTTQADKPPLLDLVDTNLSHYRTSADLEHGAHYTALPTAVLSGFNTDKEYAIGSGVAWVSADPQAKAVYLEYRGQGLDSLRNLIQDKEKQMAILGARMLEEPKKAVEAEGTIRLRIQGEQGALTTIVATVEEGVEQVMRWVAWWSGAADAVVAKITYAMNTDFVAQKMTPQELKELVAARQANEISQDTFLYNIKQGELMAPDRTIEDEKTAIQQDEDNAMEDGEVPPDRVLTPVSDISGRVSGVKP